MRLVLVGPPGSGKGTLAERLVERLGLKAIGTGEILRTAIRNRTPTGLLIEPAMKQGMLVPDSVVNEVIAELFHRPDRPEKFVLDGYPRTLAQAVAFDALLANESLPLDGVVNLTIADDEVVRRISGRRLCTNLACGALFHVVARPPRLPGICDKCGAPLAVREDDRESTIRRRLVEFHKNTDFLLEHYAKTGLLRNVSAIDPPDVIFSTVLQQLAK